MGKKLNKQLQQAVREDAMERLMIYRWISALFAGELDGNGIEFYRSGAGGEVLRDLAGDEYFGTMAGKMLALLEAGGEDIELTLAAEFGFLFHGAGGSASAPPFESVYTSENNALFQAAEKECRKEMEGCGLSVSKNFSEPADHIAVQTEFMAYLAGLTARAVKGPEKKVHKLMAQQHRFLSRHLLSWLPSFAELCEKGRPGGFYASAAALARQLLQEDHAYLARAAAS